MPKKSASATLVKGAAKSETGSKTEGDILTGVAQEVESLTQAKAFSLVEELVNSSGINEFRLGGVLAHILDESAKEGGEAWLDGCDSFKTLLDSRFGIHYRKAMYLINIYKQLVEKQIPWDEVKSLGWTKLKELTPVLTAKNVAGWVKKAEKLTVLQLIELIKKQAAKGTDATVKEPSIVTTMTFKLHADQKESVRSALDKVKEEAKTEFDSQALHLISLGVLNNSIPIGGDAPVEKPAKKGKAATTSTIDSLDPKSQLKHLMKSQGWEVTLELFGELFPSVDLQVSV